MIFIRFIPRSIKSFIFVTIQFICIGIIAFTGKIFSENIYLNCTIIPFLFLGLWAIIVMKFNFNVAPEVVENAELRTNGPYKLIRHPMYTSVLGITLIWEFYHFTYFRFIIWIILLIDLLFKLFYEEKLIESNFKLYRNYKLKTKRLIPFIF